MKFRFLTGDIDWQTYGGKFISRKLNNGNFDYWLVMEVVNWQEAVGEREASELGALYHVALSAVSPAEAGEDNLRRVAECCGIDLNDIDEITDAMRVEMLDTYGISSPVWSKNGNNLRRLMREARRQADIVGNMLFGFAWTMYCTHATINLTPFRGGASASGAPRHFLTPNERTPTHDR